MCRLMAYFGEPILLASAILWPERSIIKQSYAAKERMNDPNLPAHLQFGNLNADGFGVGWYALDNGLADGDPEPCIYTSVQPAWSNANLARLACKVKSQLLFAHVRAAYPGMPVSEENCHPFQVGRYLWMHNGVVAGFHKIRRKLLDTLSDEAYAAVPSFSSDSATCFAMFINNLPCQNKQLPAATLLAAMEQTIKTICQIQIEEGVSEMSLLNFVVTDGSTLIATRFVQPQHQQAATMYYGEGSSFTRANKHHYVPKQSTNAGEVQEEALSSHSQTSILQEAPYLLTYGQKGTRVGIIASEPITDIATDWVPIPKNTAIVIVRGKSGVVSVLRSPISIDGQQNRHNEVVRSLDAITRAIGVPSVQSKVSAVHHSSSTNSLNKPFGLNRSHQQQSYLDGASVGSGEQNIQQVYVNVSSQMQGSVGSNLYQFEDSEGIRPEEMIYQEHHMLTGHKGAILCVAVDHKNLLYTSSADCTVRQWELNKLECLHTFQSFNTQPVVKLRIAGSLLFSVAAKSIVAWHTSTYQVLLNLNLPGLNGCLRCIAIGKAGVIYAAGQDNRVHMFNTRELMQQSGLKACGTMERPNQGKRDVGKIPPIAEVPKEGPHGAVGNPKQATPCGPTSLLHAAMHAQQQRMEPAGPCQPRFGTDKNTIDKNTIDKNTIDKNTIDKNTIDKNTIDKCTKQGASSRHLDSEPTASTLISDSHIGTVYALAYCRKHVFSSGADCTIRVWDAASLQLVTVLRGHRGSVVSLYATYDKLLSGGRDNVIRVWDLDTLTCQATIQGHADDIFNISASYVFNLPESHPMFQPCNQQQLQSFLAFEGMSKQDVFPPLKSKRRSSDTAENGVGHQPTQGLISRQLNDISNRRAEGGVLSPDSPTFTLRSSTASQPANHPATSGYHGQGHGHMTHKTASPESVPLHVSASSGADHHEQAHMFNIRHLGPSTLDSEWEFPYGSSAKATTPRMCTNNDNTDNGQGFSSTQTFGGAPKSASIPICDTLKIDGAHGHGVGLESLDSVGQTGVSPEIGKLHRFLSHFEQGKEEDNTVSLDQFVQSDPGLMRKKGMGQRRLLVLSTSADGTCRVWSIGQWECLCELRHVRRGSAERMTVMAGTMAGRYIATGCDDGIVRLWSAASLVSRLQLQGRQSDGSQASHHGTNHNPSALQLSLTSTQDTLHYLLKCFVQLPTVSGIAHFKPHCLRGAKFIYDLLEQHLGAEVKLTRSQSYNPVVLARIQTHPDLPTVTFYGHYDVQPADEEDWATDPFEMTSKDGYLYGRGTSDNKGPIVAQIMAVKELLMARRGESGRSVGSSEVCLPVNVAFIYEGEEENGSKGTLEAVKENYEWLEGSEVVVICNTQWVGEQTPCITYGMRGMMSVNIEVTGPARDVHSGNDGGVFNEPMSDLTKLLATCVDSQARMLPPGFYDDVGPELLKPSLPELANTSELLLEPYRQMLGVPAITAGSTVIDLLTTRWCLPSLSIVSVQSSGSGASGGQCNCGRDVMRRVETSVKQTLSEFGQVRGGGSGDGGAAEEGGVDGLDGVLGEGQVGSVGNARAAAGELIGVRRRKGVGYKTFGGLEWLGGLEDYKFGPTKFSVIPKKAVGMVSIRFVPKQSGSSIEQCLRRHLSHEFQKLRSANTLNVQVKSVGRWWEADVESDEFKVASAAIEATWGTRVLRVREGGTMPMARELEEVLGAKAVMVPLGQASDNCHLANERIRSINLAKGKDVMVKLLIGLGELWNRKYPQPNHPQAQQPKVNHV